MRPFLPPQPAYPRRLLAILVSLLAVSILAAGLLTGCAASQPIAAAKSPGVVVAVPAAAAPFAEAAAQAYAQAGEESVQVAAIPQAAYERRIGEVLLAGLSDTDLLFIPGESLPQWVAFRALQPWKGELPGSLEDWRPLLTSDDTLYGLPAAADPLALWFRDDLRAAQNLPDPAADWDSFRAYAQAAAGDERGGFAPALAVSAAGLDLAAVMDYFGARPVAASGDGYAAAFHTPQARAAVEAYAALARDGLTLPVEPAPLGDPDREMQSARPSVTAALRAGRAALGFAPRSAGADLLNCTGNSPICAGDRPLLAAAESPAERCALLAGWSAWVVPLKAERGDAARRFAEWLHTPEGAQAWAAGSGIPITSDPGGCFATVFPPVPQPELLWDALGRLAVAALEGQDLDAAIEAAEDGINAALRRQGIGEDLTPAEK